MKIGIIGGGASGIISALNINPEYEVTILEKNDKIAKKILVTGNGKCNLWNKNLLKNKIDLKDFYETDNYDVLNNIFKYRNTTFNYLQNDLNIYMHEKNGYYYPYSNSAQSIRELFEKEIKRRENIDIIYNFEVNKIESKDNEILVYGNSNEYFKFDKVVISCGSLSSNLGTNTIQNLLNDKKIIINDILPSLVPVNCKSKYLNKWDGVRSDVKITLKNNNKIITKENGEIQLTNYGLSGIVIFNISNKIGKIINKKENPIIEIDFMPDLEDDDTLLNIFNLKFNKVNKSIEELLETFFNYKLLFVLLDNANIKKDSLWNELSSKDKNNLIKSIKHFEIEVESTLDFSRAQTCTGGISLNEITDDLELKKLKNVYVTGEILDIDGKCGGYNLANAFITGYIVGKKL